MTVPVPNVGWPFSDFDSMRFVVTCEESLDAEPVAEGELLVTGEDVSDTDATVLLWQALVDGLPPRDCRRSIGVSAEARLAWPPAPSPTGHVCRPSRSRNPRVVFRLAPVELALVPNDEGVHAFFTLERRSVVLRLLSRFERSDANSPVGASAFDRAAGHVRCVPALP